MRFCCSHKTPVKKAKGSPVTPEMKALRKIVKRIKPIFQARLTRKLRTLRGKIDLNELLEAVRTGNVTKIESLIPISGLADDLEELAILQRRGVEIAGKDAEKFFKKTIRQLIPATEANRFTFSPDNPRVANFLRRRTATMVQDITLNTRRAIQQVVGDGLRRGIPARDQAKVIREIVGLSPRQAQAVASLQESISAGRFGRLTEIQRKAIERQTGKKIKDIGALSKKQSDKIIQDYANRQLSMRAEMIARTEVTQSVNFGQNEIWQQAADEGIIDREKSVKVWVVTIDELLCPICEPLEGLEVPIGEDFSTDVGALSAPPAHPNCRCHIALEVRD